MMDMKCMPRKVGAVITLFENPAASQLRQLQYQNMSQSKKSMLKW